MLDPWRDLGIVTFPGAGVASWVSAIAATTGSHQVMIIT